MASSENSVRRLADTGYAGYFATPNGEIFTVKRPSHKLRKLNPWIESRGYFRLCLWVSPAKKKSLYLHQLIAKTFLGKCPDGHQVNHKDGNKLNNCVDNLEYVTPSQNVAHALAHGLYQFGEEHSQAKLTEEIVRIIRGSSLSQRKLARIYGVSQGTITKIKKFTRWKTDKLRRKAGGGE